MVMFATPFCGCSLHKRRNISIVFNWFDGYCTLAQNVSRGSVVEVPLNS